jgi:hypothetical protein
LPEDFSERSLTHWQYQVIRDDDSVELCIGIEDDEDERWEQYNWD